MVPASGFAQPASDLVSLSNTARPISADERRKRIAKLQGLMQQGRVGAVLAESGSTLEYFTGVRRGRSERVTAALIPADGDVTLVASAFEAPSVSETLQIGNIRTWEEDEKPALLIRDILARENLAGRPLGIEGTTRFFVFDGIRHELGSLELVSADPIVNACRSIKSAHELDLIQLANNITLAALRWVHAHVQTGMTQTDIAKLMDRASLQLGAHEIEFNLVLLNESSAFPHGSHQPQKVREGSTILMDCGCNIFGYQSDITRTWFHGEPTARQRKIWNTVRQGQLIALETARPGVPAGAIDHAVRAFYTKEGWGPGYKLPGLAHRTGHGIGLDGHEAPYLVNGDNTPLAPGMCFSDEPGLYIPGEFGVRLEDCWHMTDSGPKLFTDIAASVENPV